MVERLVWNGKKYRRYPESKHEASRSYFQRSYAGGTSLLHRDVWEHHYGPIPAGFEVHHVDGNTGNNEIGNLALLSRADHKAEHPYDANRLKRQAEHLERIRPLSKAWHASQAGQEKHREIGALAYDAFQPKAKKCAHCAGEFLPRKIGNADLYCCNACKSAARRASGADDEQRKCAACGAEFVANKYSKKKTCSRACGNVERGRTMRKGL